MELLTAGALLGLLWRTGLVILAVLLVAGLAQRYLPRLQASAGRHLQVVERVALGPQRVLYLVRAGERVLLLGGTDHHLALLAELEGVRLEEEPDAAAPDALRRRRGPGTPWTLAAVRGLLRQPGRQGG